MRKNKQKNSKNISAIVNNLLFFKNIVIKLTNQKDMEDIIC